MKSKTVREPIATWWKIARYRNEITPVQVVAFTDSFVTLIEEPWTLSGLRAAREYRERRDDFFPSFDEAKAEFIRRATKQFQKAVAELDRRRGDLKAIESLLPPLAPDIGKPLEK